MEVRGLNFYGRDDQPSRAIAVIIDFTERKLAEEMLAERNLQLELAGKVGFVGTYAYDVHTERIEISPGFAAIYGLPDGTTQITRSKWLAGVHPEDVERLQVLRSKAFRERRREYNVEYRIVRSGGEVRWIESRSFISYDSAGQPQRVVGVNIDITERKQAELALAERNAYLTLAENTARVGYFAYNLDTGLVAISEGSAAIHGLPEGTTQMTIDQWRASLQPDDLARLYELRDRMYRNRCRGYTFDYRIVRAGGEVRWIESRRFISYDGEGQPRRTIGINIDVTERKQTELI
jgi:PAS domain S-box-containing protein